MSFFKNIFLSVSLLCSLFNAYSQQGVSFVQNNMEHRVDVLVGGKFFTAYLYDPKIDKPVIFPIQTASGVTVTRGFPLSPRPNERTDHPHHIGLWLNYGDVNGLDFWNNSAAIPAIDKPKYGSIRHEKIVRVTEGKKKGVLVVASNWVDISGKILLRESTTLTFGGDENSRTIDRATTLTAQQDRVSFKDNKEGFMGVRVARELEIPSQKPEIFTDANGVATKVAVLNNAGVTGTFVSSNGFTGNEVWGTRGNWCMMYGNKNGELVSIAIIDHPSNPGYPTYWHARGYGLFAANSLGQEPLSGGKEKLNFALEAGQSVIFKYRVVITNGVTPSKESLDKESASFATK